MTDTINIESGKLKVILQTKFSRELTNVTSRSEVNYFATVNIGSGELKAILQAKFSKIVELSCAFLRATFKN